jgi:transposase
MLTALLLPPEVGLHVEALVLDEDSVTILLCTTAPTACCLGCGQLSARVHSRYTRTLRDVPCATRRVRWQLRIRRFFCLTPTCAFRTFTEPLPHVARPYARRTVRATILLQHVSGTAGGEAGARLVQRLGLPSSPDPLLRIERRRTLPAVATPRLLGVDDWAQRRGHTYGTILCDLETGRPVDLLPNRTAETFAAWLQAHPGVAIISRDRAGAYAEGGRQGAPTAVQVADRWHLLKNLGDALERLLTRVYPAQRPRLVAPSHAPASAVMVASVPQPGPTTALSAPAPPACSPVEAPLSARQQRQRTRATTIQHLHAQGASISAMARQLGLDRKTVRRVLTAVPPAAPRPSVRRRSHLDPYKPYLRERWAAGCHNAARLWAEIRTQGYAGAQTNVRQYLQSSREAAAGGNSPAARPVSVRQVRSLLQRPAQDLTSPEQQLVTEVCGWEPAVVQAYELVQAFGQMVRERRVEQLDGWLAAVATSQISELQPFVAGVRRDYAAVAAALRMAVSNGPVEGQVHRLKLIKRRGYGRAKFDLLRQRVLAPP